MRVLITGTNGMVGGAIATQLLTKGFEVAALNRKPTSIKGMAQSVQADISMASLAERISKEIDPCDAIVHTAASMDKNPDQGDIIHTNCFGTQQLLNLAKNWGVKRFIFISSVPVIGIPQSLPITEEHPTHPLTAYHASKLFGEYLVRIATNDHLEGTVLRLTSPVGPEMPDNRILSVFVRKSLANMPLQLLGQGTRQQNYIDVRDVAVVVEECLRRQISGIFNIAGKNRISNLELAERCIQILQSSSKILFTGSQDPEEGMIWDVSIKKAEKYLGFNPQYTVENTITALGAGYAAGIH